MVKTLSDSIAGRAAAVFQPRRRARSLVAVLVFVVLATLITHGHYAGSGDAVHYMMIAHSVAFDRDLDVGNDYADPHAIVRFAPELHVREGRGGHIRPVHDIGLPVLAAPFYFVAYKASALAGSLPESMRRVGRIDSWIMLRQLVSFGMIAVTVWLARRYFDFLIDLSLTPAAASAGTLAFALSPPILSHGYVFFTEIPSALTAFVVFAALSTLSTWTARRAFWIGALAGLLLLLHMRNVGLLFGLLVVASLRREWSRQTAVAFAAGLGALLAVRIAVNWSFWGTVITTPLAQTGAWPGFKAFGDEILVRGTGLLFDPNHGLLPVAPIYLLAPAGWYLLRRRAPRFAIDLAIVAGCYLLPILIPVSNVQGWRGGWSPAARFLTPIAPFIALGVAIAVARLWRARVVQALCFLQIALSAMSWGYPMTMWSEASGGSPFIAKLAGQGIADALPRWGGPAGAHIGLSLVLAAAWLVLSIALLRTARRQPSNLPEPV